MERSLWTLDGYYHLKNIDLVKSHHTTRLTLVVFDRFKYGWHDVFFRNGANDLSFLE